MTDATQPISDIDLYRQSVERLLTVVENHPGTSGGRAAAQVLLGTYNGYDFHMDLVDLVFLDPENLQAAIYVIYLRVKTRQEPHTLVDQGDCRFQQIYARFRHLHVDQRYASYYQEDNQ